jgi:hypothetical protein
MEIFRTIFSFDTLSSNNLIVWTQKSNRRVFSKLIGIIFPSPSLMKILSWDWKNKIKIESSNGGGISDITRCIKVRTTKWKFFVQFPNDFSSVARMAKTSHSPNFHLMIRFLFYFSNLTIRFSSDWGMEIWCRSIWKRLFDSTFVFTW